MRDAVPDDPAAVDWRGRFWTAALTDEQYASNQAAVAEVAGEVVGIAMSGPPLDTDATWSRQLHVLYLLADHHGSGAGAGLLSAVLPPATSAGLWVAEASERARAFYAKHGFTEDGAVRDDGGVSVIRMTR